MKKVAALLALALASVALVACGGDDDETTTTDTGGQATNGAVTQGGGEKTTDDATTEDRGGGGEADDEMTEEAGDATTLMQLEADPNGGLAYTADTAPARSGDLVIDFNNSQSIGHDVRIEDASGTDLGGTQVITESAERVTVKDLTPGKYIFYCSVPGHREAGMEGVLTVK